MVRKINNNGFSLIELLIVIAIMGVVAVLAFNMFAGVLGNSKKRADEQQANNIKKAVEIYMLDSNDVRLQDIHNQAGVQIPITSGTTSDKLIKALQEPIKTSNDRDYGPFLLANPNPGSPVSASNYSPQWIKYIGYAIEVYPEEKMCKVKPVESDAFITIH